MHYLSLLLSSFLAGSFFMASSEAHLAILIKKDFSPSLLIICATIGNTLGGMSCYLIARLYGDTVATKYLKLKNPHLVTANLYIKRWGALIALLTWLPFIGEALSVSLGLAKKSWPQTMFLMTVGRGLRYFVVFYLITL